MDKAVVDGGRCHVCVCRRRFVVAAVGVGKCLLMHAGGQLWAGTFRIPVGVRVLALLVKYLSTYLKYSTVQQAQRQLRSFPIRALSVAGTTASSSHHALRVPAA